MDKLLRGKKIITVHNWPTQLDERPQNDIKGSSYKKKLFTEFKKLFPELTDFSNFYETFTAYSKMHFIDIVHSEELIPYLGYNLTECPCGQTNIKRGFGLITLKNDIDTIYVIGYQCIRNFQNIDTKRKCHQCKLKYKRRRSNICQWCSNWLKRNALYWDSAFVNQYQNTRQSEFDKGMQIIKELFNKEIKDVYISETQIKQGKNNGKSFGYIWRNRASETHWVYPWLQRNAKAGKLDGQYLDLYQFFLKKQGLLEYIRPCLI